MSGHPRTLSEIEALNTSHLDRAATEWKATGTEYIEAFEQHRHIITAPGGTEWEGDAKDAALERVIGDIKVVDHQCEVMNEAADIAEQGSRDIQAAKARLLEAVDEAKEDGFTVNQDLSVDESRYASPLARAPERRAQLTADHAEHIVLRAQQLQPTENLVDERLQAKAAALYGTRFDVEGEDHDNTVKAVDFKAAPPVAGDGPAPSLPPPLPPGPNDEDWEHGGGQSLPSQMSAGFKQKLVALAAVEMERNGQTVSCDMLAHYLDNSGTPKKNCLPSCLTRGWRTNQRSTPTSLLLHSRCRVI